MIVLNGELLCGDVDVQVTDLSSEDDVKAFNLQTKISEAGFTEKQAARSGLFCFTQTPITTR